MSTAEPWSNPVMLKSCERFWVRLKTITPANSLCQLWYCYCLSDPIWEKLTYTQIYSLTRHADKCKLINEPTCQLYAQAQQNFKVMPAKKKKKKHIWGVNQFRFRQGLLFRTFFFFFACLFASVQSSTKHCLKIHTAYAIADFLDTKQVDLWRLNWFLGEDTICSIYRFNFMYCVCFINSINSVLSRQMEA